MRGTRCGRSRSSAPNISAVPEDADGKSCPGALVVEDEWCRQVRVAHLERADPMALRIGGFHERRSAFDEQMRPVDVAGEVEGRTRGRMLVGAVPSFDAAFLTPLLYEHHRPVMWHYQLIDVETLVAGHLVGNPTASNYHRDLAQPPWRSDELLSAVGAAVTDELRHTAMGDARWALDAYAAVYGLKIEEVES